MKEPEQSKMDKQLSTSKEIEDIVTSMMAIETTETKEKLNQNAKPNLVVGEEWAYDVVMSDSETGEKTSIIVTYNIEKIERVNKSDCYVIHAKAHHLSESSQDDEYGTIEYNVIGREKIDGRNCFKVEAKILEGNTVSLKKILWIDAEKRVLVKAQTKTPDNLLLMETHLTYTDLWQS